MMEARKPSTPRRTGKKAKRKIAVLGLSNFGLYLSRKLADLGCEVLVVDRDERRVRLVREDVAKAVIGDVTDPQTLRSLQMDEFDVVALSLGDEMGASLLSLLHLRDMGVKQILAKAVSEEHARIAAGLGATEVVFPERDMAIRTANVMAGSNILDYLPLGEEYSIVELAPDNEFIGKSLRDIDLRRVYHVEVIAVKQVLEGKALVPDSNFVIRDSDLLVVVGKNEDIERLQKK